MSEIINTVDEHTEVFIKSQKEKHQKIKNGFGKTNFQYDKTNDV